MTGNEFIADYNAGQRDFRGAILRGAILRGVILRGVDFRGADLRDAVLYDAVFRDVDLRDADLRGAVLYDADLRGVDLDYSAWPLWCGSLNVKVDPKIFLQILGHALALDVRDDDDEPDTIATAVREAMADLIDQYPKQEIAKAIKARML